MRPRALTTPATYERLADPAPRRGRALHRTLVARSAVALALALLVRPAAGAAESDDAPAATNPRPSPSAAATPAPCSAPAHRQFDFWIGSWEVKDPKGNIVGANRIERIHGGCALEENWKGRGGSTGTSLNFYVPGSGQWHQTWIGNDGTALFLAGGMDAEGRMVLSYDPPARAGSKPVRQRITWTPLADGGVRQHWETSRDDGHTWATAFDGFYTKLPR